MEKTFNMLTFPFHEDKFKDDIIKESKPLRDKFKFVMIKIAEKWLRAMRMQRKTWDSIFKGRSLLSKSSRHLRSTGGKLF